MPRNPCLGLCLVLFVVLTACQARDLGPALVAGDAAAGFALVRELGCTSCHRAEGLEPEPAPRLDRLGARLTPDAIEARLLAGPRMPDCLGALDESDRADARAELTHFLVSLGGPIAPPGQVFDVMTLERGRQLYHSVGCVACHEPYEAPATLAQPLWEFEDAYEAAPRQARASVPALRDPRSLEGIGARTTLEALTNLLVDPLAVHPSGRMPSLGLGAGEARDLASYLLYEDGVGRGAALATGPGLLLDYFEASFPGETADFDALVPARTQVATSFFEGIERRDEDFGFRFRGLIEIATAGSYRFFTTSDDGSMLYVDGRLVVDNRGQHGMSEQEGELHLRAGRHAFEVTYFEHFGGEGLEVAWSGPGLAKSALGFEGLSHLQVRVEAPEALPFLLDGDLAERGRERFEAVGCGNCHTRCIEESLLFAELDPRRGCLATKPRGPAPRYALDARQRADLAAAVQAEGPRTPTASEHLRAELERLDCGACHERGALGGPGDERRGYFQVVDDIDLGDEGRLPPSLERVGAKLKPAWFRTVLEEKGRARSYMKTRMPQFGAANVHTLPALFAEVDAPLRDEREPRFEVEAVDAGRRLAGTKGLGCIQCHELSGHPSIGIPAVDLARVHERIYPGWFRELLMDPVELKMNTRMPAFWVDGASPVEDLYDGDPARQVDALWTYLSLGAAMPLPHGLVPLPGEYELEVYDEPVCVGVFMAGVSPRTIAVGLPERVHYAFDVQHSRLAMAWRGRFIDVRGTWHGRAGELEKPAGEDVLEFPPGPALAILADPAEPWPTDMGAGGMCEVRGRGVDESRRPVFRYALGEITVSETLVARVRSGGGVLVRRFDLQGPPRSSVSLRLAGGSSIAAEEGAWSVSGPQPYRVRLLEGGRPLEVMTGGSGAELRMGVSFEGPSSRIEVEYSW